MRESNELDSLKALFARIGRQFESLIAQLTPSSDGNTNALYEQILKEQAGCDHAKYGTIVSEQSTYCKNCLKRIS